MYQPFSGSFLPAKMEIIILLSSDRSSGEESMSFWAEKAYVGGAQHIIGMFGKCSCWLKYGTPACIARVLRLTSSRGREAVPVVVVTALQLQCESVKLLGVSEPEQLDAQHFLARGGNRHGVARHPGLTRSLLNALHGYPA